MRIAPETSDALRRLHSLSGVVPIGLFLVQHLAANASVLLGPRAYAATVGMLQRLPHREAIEWLAIAVPLFFHAAVGVVVVTLDEGNGGPFRYPSLATRLSQHATGLLLAAFVIAHVWTTRLSDAVLAGGADLFALTSRQLASPGFLVFYAVGVLSAAWHLGNGLAGFAIHWRLAAGPRAERVASRIGWAVFGALSLVGTGTLLAFRHDALHRLAGAR